MISNRIAVLMVFSAGVTCAQSPSIEWQKCLGGTSNEWANCVRSTTDGGYVFAGTSNSLDGVLPFHHGLNFADVWVVKLNASGAIQWQQVLGGTANDIADDIVQTSDGGYIVAGYTMSNDGDISNHPVAWDADYWVVKLSSNGSLVWEKTIGGSNQEAAESVIQTSDGGYIVAGFSGSRDGDLTGQHDTSNGGAITTDLWVVKLSSTGSIAWQKALGGTDYDGASEILQTSDGGYVIAGYTQSHDGDVIGQHDTTTHLQQGTGPMDYWILKIDTIGNIVWQKCLGGTRNDFATSLSIADGGYVISGYSNSPDGDVTGQHDTAISTNHTYDYWVVKLSESGSVHWQKTFGGTGDDKARSVQKTFFNNYIVSGSSTSRDSDVTFLHDTVGYYGDAWLIELDSNGIMLWEKAMGGKYHEEGSCVREVIGGLIVVGRTGSSDGDVSGNYGGMDAWVVKLGHFTYAEEIGQEGQALVYPNPVHDELYLETVNDLSIDEVNVYNMSGTLAGHTKWSMPNKIDVSQLTSGVFFVEVKQGSQVRKMRFIKM